MQFTDLGGTVRFADCPISGMIFFQDLPKGAPWQETYAKAPSGSIDRLCRMTDGRWLCRDLATDHTYTQIDLETALIWFMSQVSPCWLRIGIVEGKPTCELEFAIPDELREDLRRAAEQPATAPEPAPSDTPPQARTIAAGPPVAQEAREPILKAIALDFRREGKATSAALLELFIARDEVDFETVAKEAHGGKVSDQAIRQNVLRTNRLLATKHATFQFKVASGKVFLESLPECNWDVTGM